MTAAVFKRQARIAAFIASVLLNLMAAPAFAACTTPAGNEGDINYVSSLHVMVYCNGTSWIGMGVSQPVSFGTLTTNDFCTATSGTAISCTTAAINLTSQVTSTLPTTSGGTGLTSYNKGDILYGSAANVLSALPIGTSGYILTASAGGLPTWAASTGGVTSFSAGTTGFTPSSASTGAIVLAGTLGVANGGTGLATLTSNVIYKGNGTGALAVSGLTDNGTIVSSSESIDATGKSYITEIANGSVATVLNALAKLDTSGNATKALVTDTDGIVGIVVGGAGTTGTTAQIAIDGQATCAFDGTAVVGHFVTISSTTAGDCHDTGSATRSTTAQTIGRVLTGGTTATVALGLNGAGGGAANGSTGYVQFNNAGAFLGTSNLFWDNTNFRLGIGSAIPTVGLDLSQKTDALALPVGTSGQRPACSAGSNGVLRYNSTIPAVEACVNGAWVSIGAGGGQLLGSYSSACGTGWTPACGTNYSVVFTGAAGNAPSFGGSTLTLASNTAYVVVETWGAGGGGSAGANGGNGTAGGTTCFGTNSTACTSPTLSATGGAGGALVAGVAGGVGIGGDLILTGGPGTNIGAADATGSGVTSMVNTFVGGTGGDAPRGGGGGYGNYNANGTVGAAYGGGGAGGGENCANTVAYYAAGGGGGGGGYASKFIAGPSGTYYFSIGGGGTGNTSPGTTCGSGSTVFNGGNGGPGGITVTAYSSGSTQAFNLSTQASGTLPVANGGTGDTSALTQGSVVFAGASGVYSQDNSNFFYDATNHRLGIGSASPGAPLNISGTASPLVLFDSYATAANTRWRRADGTAASPTATQAGDVVGNFGFSGYTGSAFTASNVAVKATAEENFTTSANGMQLDFFTTPIGSNVQADVMTLAPSGFVGIGTTTPGGTLDINTGASSVVRIWNVPGATAYNTVSLSGSTAAGLDIGIAGGATGDTNLYVDSGNAGNINFRTGNGSVDTQRMTILSGGNVGIGTTSPGFPLRIVGGSAFTTSFFAMVFAGTSGGHNGVAAGSTTGGNGGSLVSLDADNTILAGEFDAVSDFRKKKDIDFIQPQDGVDFVEKVNPVHFRWKKEAADAGISHGYIAQQLITAGYPSLVHLSKDETMKAERVAFDNGYVDSPAGTSFEANYLGVIPYLHAALRKVLQDFETLKADNDNLRAANDNEAAQIKALTARLDALEASRH